MRARAWLAAAGLALVLAGCAVPGAEPHAWGSSYDYGTPGAVVRAYSSVGYYPACGNEVLSFDGRSWFPYEPMKSSDLPADPLTAVPASLSASGAEDAASVTGGAGPIGAVVAPGPGDDVGTLVIYENDLAYWQADSGGLHTWLTTREVEYNWAC